MKLVKFSLTAAAILAFASSAAAYPATNGAYAKVAPKPNLPALGAPMPCLMYVGANCGVKPTPVKPPVMAPKPPGNVLICTQGGKNGVGSCRPVSIRN